MSNQLYGLGKQKFMSGSINLSSDTIVALLVKSAYTPNFSTHEFISDLGANVLNSAQTLSGKSITLGVFDANDVTFAAVTAGDTAKAVVIAKNTGSNATSPLLAYIDTITGFPLATNGGDITIQWDSGAYKIWSF